MSGTKKSKMSIMFGVYLIIIGSFWLGNIRLALVLQEFAPDRYEAGLKFLQATSETAGQYEFKNEAQKNEYLVKYKDFEDYNERIYIENARSVPFPVIMIISVAMSAAILYLFSGFLVLRRSEYFIKYFRLGGYCIVLHFVLVIVSLLYDILPMTRKVNDLARVLEQPEMPSLINVVTSPAILFPLVMFGIVYSIYVILPKIIIRRLKIK